MSNTRQAGHYWVKLDDPVSPDWHVAQWHDNNGDGSDWCWHSHYLNGKAYDGSFSEINETRIPNPDEVKDNWVAPTLLVGGQHVAFMNEESLREFMRFAKINTVTFEPDPPKTYALS